jgi:hypothetical protein
MSMSGAEGGGRTGRKVRAKSNVEVHFERSGFIISER